MSPTLSFLFMAGIFMAFALAFFTGALAEVNPLQTSLAGEPPPTWADYRGHWKALAGGILVLASGVSVLLSVLLAMGRWGWEMSQGRYHWSLRRRARAALTVQSPSELILTLKMLEIEQEEAGWQLETMHAYLDAVQVTDVPVDPILLKDFKDHCRRAHAEADAAIADRTRALLDFSGRPWVPSELIIEAQRLNKRVQGLRFR